MKLPPLRWVLLFFPLLVFTGADGALAQSPTPDAAAVAAGKRVWERKAGCLSCHGWAGNGESVAPNPEGPSLRETTLSPEQIHEVIRCGRPGTSMPHFDRRAYQDGDCFGLTEADLGPDMPLPGTFLSSREIDNLMAYLQASVVGRGEITLAECEEYYGAGARTCEEYR